MTQSSSLLSHFGISETGHYDSSMAKMFRSELSDVAHSGGMAALVGAPGSGKTFMLREVEAALTGQVQFVKLLDLTDRHLRIASILSDLVVGLSSESPRRSTSSLSHQALRLLGETVVRQGRRVCLVIDDAQRLHPSTLTALKRLREQEFAGKAPLLSVILVGWPELADTIRRRKDILWRCELLLMTEREGWMTIPERTRFLRSVYGDAIDEETRLTIAMECQVPEEMNAFVIEKMREARRAGFDRLDVRTVAQSSVEIAEKLGITYSMIASEMGMSTTTAHRALHDGAQNPHYETARAAVRKIAAGLTQSKAS